MKTLPEFEHGENSWVAYNPTDNRPYEFRKRSNAELALKNGWKVVTITKHLYAVQKDVDNGGDGSGAWKYDG